MNKTLEKNQRTLEEALVHHDELNKQEIMMILDAFDSENGVFVEVGANDPFVNSISYPLECIGWRGILIDPLKKCYLNIQENRPLTKSFHCACVAPEQVGKITLHAPDETSVYASVGKNIDDIDVTYKHSEVVEALTLDQILESLNRPSIDLLSIDTEGTELDVLRGLDLSKNQPRLIIIEDKLYNLSKHSYLKKNGYKLVKRTMVNSWYVKRDESSLYIVESFTEKLARWRKYNPLSIYFRNRRRFNKSKKLA
jgi:FkbM family methyltransferase